MGCAQHHRTEWPGCPGQIAAGESRPAAVWRETDRNGAWFRVPSSHRPEIAMRIPIRVRLTAVYCVIFTCSTLLLELAAYWGVSAAIYAIVDHDLRARVGGVEGFLNE